MIEDEFLEAAAWFGGALLLCGAVTFGILWCLGGRRERRAGAGDLARRLRHLKGGKR